MAVYIDNGNPDVVLGSFYGRVSDAVQQRNMERFERFQSNIIGPGVNLFKESLERVKFAYSDKVEKLIHRVKASQSEYYREDELQYLGTQPAIAIAPPKMQMILLAQSQLFTLFSHQGIEGFGFNYDPNEHNAERIESIRRVVNNGRVVQETGADRWYSEYEYGLHEVEGHSMNNLCQIDIIDTWNVIDDLIEQGIDPTSKLGEKLYG